MSLSTAFSTMALFYEKARTQGPMNLQGAAQYRFTELVFTHRIVSANLYATTRSLRLSPVIRLAQSPQIAPPQ
jgi:hypothetical protein